MLRLHLTDNSYVTHLWPETILVSVLGFWFSNLSTFENTNPEANTTAERSLCHFYSWSYCTRETRTVVGVFLLSNSIIHYNTFWQQEAKVNSGNNNSCNLQSSTITVSNKSKGQLWGSKNTDQPRRHQLKLSYACACMLDSTWDQVKTTVPTCDLLWAHDHLWEIRYNHRI